MSGRKVYICVCVYIYVSVICSSLASKSLSLFFALFIATNFWLMILFVPQILLLIFCILRACVCVSV